MLIKLAPKTMLKLDIDKIHHKPRLCLQMVLYAMPRPFFARLSSSRGGLHLAVPGCREWDYRRIAYDDPMRVDLDTQRMRHRLPVHNLLWDMKDGKRAGYWQTIRTETDIEHFIDVNKQQHLICQGTHPTIMPEVIQENGKTYRECSFCYGAGVLDDEDGNNTDEECPRCNGVGRVKI